MKPSGTFHNTDGSTKDNACGCGVAVHVAFRSCGNTHNPSEPSTVNSMPSLRTDVPTPVPPHTGAVLSGNNGAVAEDATRYQKPRRWRWRREASRRASSSADENISGLDFAGLGQVVDDRRSTMNSAGEAPVPVMDIGVPAGLTGTPSIFRRIASSQGRRWVAEVRRLFAAE